MNFKKLDGQIFTSESDSPIKIIIVMYYNLKYPNQDNATPYSELVEATHRIDERALRKLVPIVKIEDLREKCGSWFGVAFLARQVTCSGNMFDRLSSFEV